jgi:hypothetical protein
VNVVLLALVMAGAWLTMSVAGLDVPPPGLGVTTVNDKVPGFDSCVAGITAANWVELTKVGTSELPPTVSVDCGVNPVPVSVSSVSPLPAWMLVGEIEVMDGEGLLIVAEVEPLCVLSAAGMAVMVTIFGTGGTAGAVYKPEVLSMLPQAAPPAGQPTDQVTV